MLTKLIFFVIIIFSLQNHCYSQDGGSPPKKDQSIKSKWKQRRADKKQWKEDRINKRAEERRVRNHHKRIQTKSVRKRMKNSKVTAQRNHDNKREPFFKRMFKKKRNKGSKQPGERKSKP